MPFALTDDQRAQQAAFAAFADEHLAPGAARRDREQRIEDAVVAALAAAGWIVPTAPSEAGGRGMDAEAYGLLSEEVGRACGSVRNLLGVQGMVAHAILRWGTGEQIDRWVPRIAAGEALASFALTEPAAGSDARAMTTTAVRSGAGYVLEGRKTWISFAARAHVLLVFAALEGHPAAFVVERDAPGLATEPIDGLLGLRASHLATVTLDRVTVPAAGLLASGPLAFDTVVAHALDFGRYSTACGAVGLAEACLRASLERGREREQFGSPIGEHQLIGRMLSRMTADVAAARLLCREAGALRAAGDPDALRRTLVAKYFATTHAFNAASDAVQIHGAMGCGPDAAPQRLLRDAKIQEIVEGTTQIQELHIADMTSVSRAAR